MNCPDLAGFPQPARFFGGTPFPARNVRYVRDYLNGSNKNAGNHWVEIEVWGTRTTVYVGAHYEKNVTGNAATSYYYLGGQRIAQRRAGVVYYLHSDHLGSASLTTDASGNRVGELRYKPYGETRYIWGVTRTDRRYTGQREEVELGLYDYGARFYDPLLAHFISADTIVPSSSSPQSLNRYAYVLNSPLRYRDPSGHTPIDICAATRGNAPGCGSGPIYAASTLVNFSGKWGLAYRVAVVGAAEDAAARMYEAIQADRQRAYAIAPRLGRDPAEYSTVSQLWGLSQDELFLAAYNGQITFLRQDTAIDGWALTNLDNWTNDYPGGVINYDNDIFADNSGFFDDCDGVSCGKLNVVHELSHGIDQRGGRQARAHLAATWDSVPLQRGEGGWAGDFPGWQQSRGTGEGEVFADMGVGWTYSRWAAPSARDYSVGVVRSLYMEANMPRVIALAVAGN